MSRSRRDGKGKRIAGEIAGRSYFGVAQDRLVMRAGGEEVGSPLAKRNAKRDVSRKRRREPMPTYGDA